MSSQSFFDRFTSPHKSPILPLHGSPRRIPSEYDLDELEPRPHDGLLEQHSFSPSQERFHGMIDHDRDIRREKSPHFWNNDRASSAGSASKRKPRAMFAGPPPPIAASMVLKHGGRDSRSREPAQSSNRGISSVLFDQREEQQPAIRVNSVWRGLRRQEKALEKDIQELLDLQAAGLIAGLGGRPPSTGDFGDYSDAGSSTPTGTFYSTATSKSRMVQSLHMPARANADGNVIPVRQPRKTKQPGLRTARSGLRKTMVALTDLKTEEDAHIDAALLQRKTALLQLDRLSSRREDIRQELHSLEEDDEEPLGRDLREIGSQYDALTQEIQEMEERLVGMRNRRRMLRSKMEDVKSRRDAGLSGYRGALRDVDAEVTSLMRQPPIQPLDQEILSRTAVAKQTLLKHNSGSDAEEEEAATTGLDFLRLLPERRTVEMARSWWQSEVHLLTRRKAQIEAERTALEEGGALWSEVMNLVTDFEKRLRLALRAASGLDNDDESGSGNGSGKGKEKVPNQEEAIREQMPLLQKSIEALEGHMVTAEKEGWNLLICAIGAELEAFREAADLLRGVVDGDGDDVDEPSQTNTGGHARLVDDSNPTTEAEELARPFTEDVETKADPQADDKGRQERAQHSGRHGDGDEVGEESDNEPPNDLLISRIESREDDGSSRNGVRDRADDDDGKRPSMTRRDSENDVPAEFLGKHDGHEDKD